MLRFSVIICFYNIYGRILQLKGVSLSCLPQKVFGDGELYKLQFLVLWPVHTCGDKTNGHFQ